MIKMVNKPIIFEVWDFVKVRKKYWLLPIIIMLILAGVLIIFGQSSAITPLVYMLA